MKAEVVRKIAKTTLTYIYESWTITKKNKSKPTVMEITFLKIFKEKHEEAEENILEENWELFQ